MSKLSSRLAGVCAASLLCVSAANAAVVVTVLESDGNVIFSMEGSLDLSGLTLGSELQVDTGGLVSPEDGFFGWTQSDLSTGTWDVYIGDIDYPEVFGTGGATETGVSSGDNFGLSPIEGFALRLPANYVSGDPLSGGMIFEDATLESLGMEPGMYVWTLPADTVTLDVVIPVPAAVWLFGSALGMLGWLKRRVD